MTTWQWRIIMALVRLTLQSRGLWPLVPEEEQEDLEFLIEAMGR